MMIRELKPTDFDDFVSTFFSYFDEVKDDPSFGLALMREKPTMDEERIWFDTVLKDMQEGNVVNVVAEVDSHVIGNCVVRRVKPNSPEDHRGSLGIAVKKGFRGRGIGEALMRAAIDRSRGRFEIIELAVVSTNQGAKQLYEKLGFTTYGTRKYALKRGGGYYDEDLMYLKL
jgi:ribosomal protein S18 acetylase RimI-like enzyme